jgi:hypothetical protein
MKVPIRLTAEEQEHHDHHQDERLDQGLEHLVDGVGDEHGRIVGDLPGEIVGEALLQLGDLVLHGLQGGDRVGAGALVHRDCRGRPAVESGLAVEIGGAELDARHVAQPQHRSVRIGADDDVLELGGGAQPTLGLDVELELLVVGNGARADAPDRGLDVLRLDGVDDVAGGQVEPGELVGADPGAHRIVLRTPQCGVAHARRALDLVEHVDGDVIRQVELVVRVLGRVERDHAEQRRRLLLDRDALALHVLRQARQRHLDAVVDVDGVGVGIGAEVERDGERVAAVVAAHALHVDRLVDADHLRLDRLRDGLLDHARIGARIERGDRDLRRHDVGILGDRDDVEREQARDRGDDRDDAGEPRPVDEDGREHGLSPR